MDPEQQPKDGGIAETGKPLLTPNQGRFTWVSISVPRCEMNPHQADLLHSSSSLVWFSLTFLSDMETEKKNEDSSATRLLTSCQNAASQVCSLQFLKERLPPLTWAPSYNLDMLTGDFIAGVTTALTVIPQGIGRFLFCMAYQLWSTFKFCQI